MRVVTSRLFGGAASLIACAALAAVPIAKAEPGAFSSQDETFFRLLTGGTDDTPGLAITNYPLVRTQGLITCQRRSAGIYGLDTIHMLQAEGPYSFDVANSISSAAAVAYCPEHLGF